MAKLDMILQKNGKKLVISQFLSESVKEKDKDGNYKEDFVTIHKLSYEDKTRIKMLSLKTFSANTQKEIAKKLKQSGKTIKDLQNIDTDNDNEVAELLMDIDYTNLETDKMADGTIDVARFIIEKGLDIKQHSFKNSKNKAIELNYDTLNMIGNEGLIKFIIDNIKIISQGFLLGE